MSHASAIRQALCDLYRRVTTLLALLVDPDSQFLPQLGRAVARAGWGSIVQTTFVGARRELEVKHPNAVIANAKLGMFNGVHLAYLAKRVKPKSITIVYADGIDPALGVEAQRANAFYERGDFVMYSLPSYLRAHLPARDRRSVWVIDRRLLFRGGRRVTDQQALRISGTGHSSAGTPTNGSPPH